MAGQSARSRDGTGIWFEDGGGEGAPLLFLHGFSGSSSAAGHLARRAASAGRRLIRMDLRGHGLSDKPRSPDAFALARFSDDVIAVLDACGVTRSHLVGHCFGGLVAVRTALDHPGRVASLSLVSTSARPSVDASRLPATFRFARRHGRRLAKVAFPERGARTPHVDYSRFGDMGDLYWRRMLADYRALTGRVAFAVMDEIDGTDLLEDSRALSVPSLVMHGADDGIFGVLAAERLSAVIPAARLVIMPGHNHVTPVLDPDSALFDAVLSFTAEVRSAGLGAGLLSG